LRFLTAIIVFILCALPGLFAGLPDLQPAWFSDSIEGVPLSVVCMVASMAAFVALAGVCSAAARGQKIAQRGDEA
jgi:hypothetical protein